MSSETPPKDLATRAGWIGAIFIVLGVALAYTNSVHGVYVLDDFGSIADNRSIHHPGTALFPPGEGRTVSGRPLLNLSFALNYAWGRESIAGYHVVNVAIHALAALALFGIVRRTLELPALAPRWAERADPAAALIALIWALHPLQTESVTYVVQRAESLAGLMILLTIYCFVRGVTPGASARWLDASIALSLVSALAKETAVILPILLLLFDRLLVTPSWAEIARRRGIVYLGLALNWLIICWNLAGTGGRGGTAGFGTSVSHFDYAMKQLEAIPHYLRLAFWPSPLILDYGTSTAVTPTKAAIGLVVIAGLLLAGFLARKRRPGFAFLVAAFFLALGPTSSFVPVATQVMAEHRMYLPLAAVVVAAVLALFEGMPVIVPPLALMVAIAAGFATVHRNRDYASQVVLWTQCLAVPENTRAELNLSQALIDAGRSAEAIPHCQALLRLDPHSAEAHNNWGNALVELNRLDEACAQFDLALREKPGLAIAHFNLGNTLMKLQRVSEAIAQYHATVRVAPGHSRAHANLGNALVEQGDLRGARAEFETAIRLTPENPTPHLRLGGVLMVTGDVRQAIAEFETAVQLDPGNAEAARKLAAARAYGSTPH
ncbi:MAG TPA: tetratricopeptide repeat protein [Candidatus Didemnitutus sp.]|nr:tetratricopeptide repeat protein [Candidatus Didemnitutus sp.]